MVVCDARRQYGLPSGSATNRAASVYACLDRGLQLGVLPEAPVLRLVAPSEKDRGGFADLAEHEWIGRSRPVLKDEGRGA